MAASDALDRPRVIVSVTASADGRVTPRRSTTLFDPAGQAAWQAIHPPGAADLLAERHAWLEERYGHRVVLEGSGTFVTEDTDPAPLPPTETDADADDLHRSWLPAQRETNWFVVVDGRGRIRWSFTGDDRVRLLVLVCRETPPAYLAYLRREEIPYLVAGTDRVDLVAALQSLGSELGARSVISEAGGGLNGALLRAGLVDELHLVTLPGLIGGRDTPAVFDGDPLPAGQSPETLDLVGLRRSQDGALWLDYAVNRGEVSRAPVPGTAPGGD